MKKQKTTKHALLMSALALLLCMSMLVGTTFAWFTDEVTSAGNVIKSGTLDVAFEWADGKTDPEATTWNDASTSAIFNYDLWEPGYTEVRHIKISNNGTLALKYQVYIIANGEVSKLSDVIDVYYVDPAVKVTDRTVLTDDMKLGTLTEVLANLDTTGSGHLLAGESVTITLALKMQEEAGNEYQDLSIGSDFTVKLLATQYTYENDSFDNQYDADAEIKNPFVIYNMDDLRTAAAKGGKYVLGDDIVMSADEAVIPVKADFVLDTKDFGLDFSAFATRPFEIDEGVSFTINAGDDSIIAGQKGFVNVNNASTLIVNGGKFSGAVASGQIGALIRVASKGKTTIQLNNVDYTTTANAITLDSSNYSGAAEDLNITVNGGNYSTGYIAFYLNGNSNTTIKNATITAGNVNSTASTVGVFVTIGKGVKIDNCQITSNGTGKDSGGVTVQYGAYLTVKDSTITAAVVTAYGHPYALRIYSTGGTIDVTNTTYNNDPSQYISGKTHPDNASIIVDGEEIYGKEASN